MIPAGTKTFLVAAHPPSRDGCLLVWPLGGRRAEQRIPWRVAGRRPLPEPAPRSDRCGALRLGRRASAGFAPKPARSGQALRWVRELGHGRAVPRLASAGGHDAAGPGLVLPSGHVDVGDVTPASAARVLRPRVEQAAGLNTRIRISRLFLAKATRQERHGGGAKPPPVRYTQRGVVFFLLRAPAAAATLFFIVLSFILS